MVNEGTGFQNDLDDIRTLLKDLRERGQVGTNLSFENAGENWARYETPQSDPIALGDDFSNVQDEDLDRDNSKPIYVSSNDVSGVSPSLLGDYGLVFDGSVYPTPNIFEYVFYKHPINITGAKLNYSALIRYVNTVDNPLYPIVLFLNENEKIIGVDVTSSWESLTTSWDTYSMVGNPRRAENNIPPVDMSSLDPEISQSPDTVVADKLRQIPQAVYAVPGFAYMYSLDSGNRYLIDNISIPTPSKYGVWDRVYNGAGVLDDTDTMQNILITENASDVSVLIDNESGGDPTQYSIEFQYWNAYQNEFMQYSKFTGETSRSWSLSGDLPLMMNIVLTNTSGATNPYRVVAEAWRS